MENFIVLRIEKVNSKSKMSARLNHNYRVKEKNESLNNVDLEKTKDNILLVGMNKEEAYKYFEEKISLEKQRKNAVFGVEFVLSASPDWFKNGDLKEFTKRALEFVKKEMTEENIISAVLHLDETTPHIHFMTMPLKDNKLNFKAFYKNKFAFERLQDKAGIAFGELGLKRGIKKSISKKQHQDFNQYKNEVLETETELKGLQEKTTILNIEFNKIVEEFEKPQKDKKSYSKTATDILKNLENLKLVDFMFKKEEFIDVVKRLLLNSPVHKELFKLSNNCKSLNLDISNLKNENTNLKDSLEKIKETSKNRLKRQTEFQEENKTLKRQVDNYKKYYNFINYSPEIKKLYIDSFKVKEEKNIVEDFNNSTNNEELNKIRSKLKL